MLKSNLSVSRIAFIMAVGVFACRDLEHTGAPLAGTASTLKQADKVNESGTGRIGMNGYGRFLQEGYTGSGAPMTAGLQGRGGGPVSASPSDEGARSLGPNEHFGTSHRVRPLTVTLDDGTTALYQPKVNHK